MPKSTGRLPWLNGHIRPDLHTTLRALFDTALNRRTHILRIGIRVDIERMKN